MKPADGSLAGRAILFTRSPEDGRGVVTELGRLGARVDCRPTIRLCAPEDAGPVRVALQRLGTYAWILFTSANGVRFFRAALDASGATGRVAARVAAVGAATAVALRKAGLSVDVVSRVARAEGLARELEGRIGLDDAVLIVRGDLARPVLADALRPRAGRVDSVVFYRNRPAPELRQIAADLCAGRYDAVVLSSPSSLARLLEVDTVGAADLREALRRVRRVAIGPVTGRALEEAELPADRVATEPTDAGICEAVAAVYRP